MHFYIAYQGTTITVDSEIGNDQRESTNACFFEQGFKQNLVFFFFFFFFIDCSHIYKHYINSVIITLLTDIICTKLTSNNTLRTTVTIQCKLTLLEIRLR